jgi:ATP-dependent phosphofructokinase / diphosphate-dependent phosphofructokinase
MTTETRRIAINCGGGYVPGLNAVITGAVLAATELGWEIVGIRDGYEGLLFPDRYSDGGIMKLTHSLVEDLAGTTGCVVGTAGHTNPFRVRSVNADNYAEELDRSDELITIFEKEKIDAVVSVVEARELGIAWKLSRKGLKVVCIPKSVENDVAATALSFGFNTALSFVTDMLERCCHAARSAKKIGVVEVPGEHAGWLALQAAMAVCADAVLIPEIPFDLKKVGMRLKKKADLGRPFGIVVVAEGARAIDSNMAPPRTSNQSMRDSLSPGATGDEGFHVIRRSGLVAQEVALQIQRLTDLETYPLVLDQLTRGGSPTVVDRQLGLGYGAGAVRALNTNQSGVMEVFQPPDVKFVPITDAINKVRTVPADSEFVQIARALGMSLGD